MVIAAHEYAKKMQNEKRTHIECNTVNEKRILKEILKVFKYYKRKLK